MALETKISLETNLNICNLYKDVENFSLGPIFCSVKIINFAFREAVSLGELDNCVF